jgi:hypothetical protein
MTGGKALSGVGVGLDRVGSAVGLSGVGEADETSDVGKTVGGKSVAGAMVGLAGREGSGLTVGVAEGIRVG